MSEPFLAEIRIIAADFAPRGWALCDGQILPINQNQSLYSLLGTTYGGDGLTNFALPDMRGRAPIHAGTGNGLSPRVLGERSGEETHTLSVAEIPNHTHAASATSSQGQTDTPANSVWADAGVSGFAATADGVMHPSSVSGVGGGQAHDNMQPHLALNYIIALQGLFPSRN